MICKISRIKGIWRIHFPLKFEFACDENCPWPPYTKHLVCDRISSVVTQAENLAGSSTLRGSNFTHVSSAVHIYDFHIFIFIYFTIIGYHELTIDHLSMWLGSSVVRALHRYCKVMGSNLIQAWIFFRLLFQLLKLIAHCEDQISLNNHNNNNNNNNK